jgi:hypothetical protein
MESPRTFLLLSFCLSLLTAATAGAVAEQAAMTMNTSISGRASLVLGSANVSFPSADPSLVPVIPAAENPVPVTARVRTGSGSAATLQVLAGGDLTSGGDTIAVGNVSWSATGGGFSPGAMSKTAAQGAGSWTGPGERSGSFSYFLANSWAYPAGAYSTTVTYTLTAP